MLKVEEYRHQAMSCCSCRTCNLIDANWVKSARFAWQCPIERRYRFNLYSPQGIVRAALSELDGRLEFTEKFVDALFKCTLCGGCDIRCKRNLDVEVLQVIETLRYRAAEVGKIPIEHQKIAENLSKNKNIFGAAHRDRIKQIKGSKPTKKADIVYFVGCESSYTHPELAQATAELLSRSDTPFMFLDDEWCCGYQLLATGQLKLAQEMVKHNIEAIEKSGAKTVITSCAECYKTLNVDYPKVLEKSTVDMPYTVLHIVEYVDKLMKDEKLKFAKAVPMKVTYHDPCNLARLSEPWYQWEPNYLPPNIAVGKIWRRGDNGVYQPPRDVLKGIPGIELVEMDRTRDNAWCCGSGGGVDVGFPNFALWTAMERLEEAKETGAEAVVTACPRCKEIFTKAINAGKTPMAVHDIIELVLRSMS